MPNLAQTDVFTSLNQVKRLFEARNALNLALHVQLEQLRKQHGVLNDAQAAEVEDYYKSRIPIPQAEVISRYIRGEGKLDLLEPDTSLVEA